MWLDLCAGESPLPGEVDPDGNPYPEDETEEPQTPSATIECPDFWICNWWIILVVTTVALAVFLWAYYVGLCPCCCSCLPACCRRPKWGQRPLEDEANQREDDCMKTVTLEHRLTVDPPGSQHLSALQRILLLWKKTQDNVASMQINLSPRLRGLVVFPFFPATCLVLAPVMPWAKK